MISGDMNGKGSRSIPSSSSARGNPTPSGLLFPLKAAAIYTLVAVLGLLFFDWLVRMMVRDQTNASGWRELRIWAFVLATAALCVWVVHYYLRRLSVANVLLAQRETHFRLIFENTPVAYQSLDPEGRILEVNPAWLKMTGYERAEAIGRPFDEFLLPSRSEVFRRELSKNGGSAEAKGIVLNLRRKDGSVRIVEASGRTTCNEDSPFKCIHCILHDITEHMRREQEIARLNRLYAALSQVNQAVVRARSREEVFNRVCRAALTYGGFKLAWVGWLDPQTKAIQPVASCGDIQDILPQFQVIADDSSSGRGPTGVAIREKRTVVCNRFAEDPGTIPWRKLAAQYDIGSAASFPIRIGGEVCGALVLYANEADFFQKREVLLLEEAASDISFALSVLEAGAQRRQAEEALRRQESRTSSLFRASPIGIGLARDRIIIEANDRLCEMTGYKKEELIGQNTSLLYASQGDYEYVGRELYARIHAHPVGSIETRWRRKDGSLYEVLLHSSVLEPMDHAAGMTFTATDITERKKVEEQVRRLSRALEQSPVSVIITDLEGKIEFVNARFTQVTGYKSEEVMGQSPRILKSGDTSPAEYGRMWRTITTGGEWHCQFRNRKKNGDFFWELASISPIRDSQGAITHFLAIKEDITERKLAQERILAQAALLDQTQDAILVIALDHRIKYCNRAAELLYACKADDLTGQLADAYMFPETAKRCDEVCRMTLEHGNWSGEIRLPGDRGNHRFVYSRSTLIRDAKGEPVSFLITNTDVTEIKKLEQQFLRAQRMESIGTLASGVAHDLNNILAPILMGIEVFRPLAKDSQDQAILKMLNDGVKRGADIVRQLLAFGRGLEGQLVELEPLSLLKEMARVIRETFPRSITLDQQFSKELWLVRADPTQVHQVLLNLCVNARDAMPNGGTLTIAAENLEMDEICAGTSPEAKPGPYVALQVSDTGTGIPPELLDKIFDPFFTTKEPGKGTGLGLSTVMGIVKNHGGFLQVISRVGQGTSFKVYLPALRKGEVRSSGLPSPRLPRGNGQLILVIDDEEAIRNVARRTLEGNGYQVILAADGAEGLNVYGRSSTEIRAVITDLIMPVMDGAALIRALRGQSPDLVIIAMSGLATLESEAVKPECRADAFLRKPFTAEALLVSLHQLLPNSASD